MINLSEIVREILSDIECSSKIYCKSSGYGAKAIPERILQCSFFLCYAPKYTMTCEQLVESILEDSKKSPKQRDSYGRQAVDLAIYDSTDLKKSDQQIKAIVEFKNGWLDVWKDILRSEEILTDLEKTFDTYAICCACVTEKKFQDWEKVWKDRAEQNEIILEKTKFDIAFEDGSSEKCIALVAYKVVSPSCTITPQSI